MALHRFRHNSANFPGDWLDSTRERRVRFSLTNSSGVDVHDHLATYTLPVTPDGPSIQVVAKTAAGSVDRDFDWRYGPLNAGDVNHLLFMPAKVSGTALTVKTLGRWANNEVRLFEAYWSGVNGQTNPGYSHLGFVAFPWVVTILAGSTGDLYKITVNGTLYTYTQAVADTATLIAVGLKNLINAGSQATATNTAGVLSVFSAAPSSPAYTVSTWLVNTGSTTVGNVACVAPAFFGVGRVGPDTVQYPIPSLANSYLFGVGVGVSTATSAGGYICNGRSSINTLIRHMRYSVNGDAGNYFGVAAVITSVTLDGPTVTITGTMSTTATGSHPNFWTGTFTYTYQHKILSGIKSDNTNPNNVDKYVDILRCQIVWTCGTTYAPTTAGGVGTNVSSNHIIVALADSTNTFAGNVTELGPAGSNNMLANYYALAGAGPTSYAASADLHTIPVVGTVMGGHGNTHSFALIINSLAFGGGYPGPATPQWFANANPFPQVNVLGLINTTNIPAGATVTLDYTMASSFTSNATTVGDNLLPSEIVTLLQNYAYAPASALVANETYSANTQVQTALSTSTRLVAGCKWKQNNCFALLGQNNNYAWGYNPKTGAFEMADDGDGTTGESFMLAGLILRYKRTGDTTLLPLIRNQVKWYLDLEKDAVNWYGSWWKGSAPYWRASFAGQQMVLDGGFHQPGIGAAVDPNAPNYGTLTQMSGVVLPIGTAGGAWRGAYNGATTYNNLDWVTYVDTGGAYSGQGFYSQWIGGSSGSTPTPTDSSGNSQGNWQAKNPLQYTVTFVVNQPEAATSQDQMHAVCIGLYHYLYICGSDPILAAALPDTWYVGDVVPGSNGNAYTLVIAGTAVTYTQVSADATTIATGVAAAVNANSTLTALGVSASVVQTAKATPGTAALYLSGCTGLTVTNAGTTTPGNMPVATLMAAATAYLKRMADFQSQANPNGNTGLAKTSMANSGVPPLYNLVTGTTTYTPTQNGIATGKINYAANVAMPSGVYAGPTTLYGGSTVAAWELAQTDATVLNSDSNGTLANLFITFATIASPAGQASDQAAIIAYLTGRASDVVALDMGRHAWRHASALATAGVPPPDYPVGHNVRSAGPGNNGRTQAAAPNTTFGAHSSDPHYIEIGSAGYKDHANARAYERLAMLCIAALFNPALSIPVEWDNTASPNAVVTRSVPITTLCDDLVKTLSLYMMEASTFNIRFGATGALGIPGGTNSTWFIHTNMTGYALASLELYLLVQRRVAGQNLLPTYYRFPGV